MHADIGAHVEAHARPGALPREIAEDPFFVAFIIAEHQDVPFDEGGGVEADLAARIAHPGLAMRLPRRSAERAAQPLPPAQAAERGEKPQQSRIDTHATPTKACPSAYRRPATASTPLDPPRL